MLEQYSRLFAPALRYAPGQTHYMPSLFAPALRYAPGQTHYMPSHVAAAYPTAGREAALRALLSSIFRVGRYWS